MLFQALYIISMPSMNSNWSYSPEMPDLGQSWQWFVPCDLEFSWMTLKNNRIPFICFLELCVSFHSNRWIQTGVTIRNHRNQVKVQLWHVWIWHYIAWSLILTKVLNDLDPELRAYSHDWNVICYCGYLEEAIKTCLCCWIWKTK